jgi:integrase
MRTRDIDAAGRVWHYRPAKHKTAHHGHVRSVPIGRRAQVILGPFLKVDLEAFCFSPAEAEAERRELLRSRRKTPVQPSQVARAKRAAAKEPRFGQRYSVRTYRQAIERACDKADRVAKGGVVIGDGPDDRLVPRWHPHLLRHNAATRWRSEYGPDKTLVMLGDKTARMVDVYAEQDLRAADQIAWEVG